LLGEAIEHSNRRVMEQEAASHGGAKGVSGQEEREAQVQHQKLNTS